MLNLEFQYCMFGVIWDEIPSILGRTWWEEIESLSNALLIGRRNSRVWHLTIRLINTFYFLFVADVNFIPK